jgi:oligopeptide transport system permease protein
VALIAFSVWIPLFPVGAWGPRGALLPAFTLSLPFAAYIARLTRMGMIEVLGADFIRTARAKGVSETRILLKHALKNAFLPVLSYLGPATALAMTGSFVVERVFNVPGMGQHFVNAVLNKDLFLIMGVVLVYATMLILFNLIVDVLYKWVDPRME